MAVEAPVAAEGGDEEPLPKRRLTEKTPWPPPQGQLPASAAPWIEEQPPTPIEIDDEILEDTHIGTQEKRSSGAGSSTDTPDVRRARLEELITIEALVCGEEHLALEEKLVQKLPSWDFGEISNDSEDEEIHSLEIAVANDSMECAHIDTGNKQVSRPKSSVEMALYIALGVLAWTVQLTVPVLTGFIVT